MKAMIQHESERLGVARGVDDVPSFEMEMRESFPQLCMPRSPPEGVFTLYLCNRKRNHAVSNVDQHSWWSGQRRMAAPL